MNEFEVIITQNPRNHDLNSTPFQHKQVRKTMDDYNDLTVKLFSLRIFGDYFRKVESSRRLKVKRFDLTRPIYFETHWNNDHHKKFVLTYYNSSSIDILLDINIQIGKRIYILFEEKRSDQLIESMKINKSNNCIINENECLNLEILFNAIEFNEREIKKKSTPIIYTGMTN